MSIYNIFFLKLETTKHLRHTRGNMSRVYTTLVISYYLTSLVPPASSDCDTRKKNLFARPNSNSTERV